MTTAASVEFETTCRRCGESVSTDRKWLCNHCGEPFSFKGDRAPRRAAAPRVDRLSSDDAIRLFANRQLDAGVRPRHVLELLQEKGLPSTQARSFAYARGGAGRGVGRMVIGAVVAGVGIVITLATYDAASRAGGTYIVAWGAILMGGFQFMRGLFTAVRER